MAKQRAEGRITSYLIEIFLKVEWLLFGYFLMVSGYFIWDNNLDLIILSFSLHNTSAGFVLFGLIVIIIGVLAVVIDIVSIPAEGQLTKKDIHNLFDDNSVSKGISTELVILFRERITLISGGFLMLIGFGFWDSNYDIPLHGLFFQDLSAFVVFVGVLLAIFGGIPVLNEVSELIIRTKDFKKANPKVSFGLIASSVIEGQSPEIILTSPEFIPLSDEVLGSIVERSVLSLEVPQSVEGNHIIFPFPVAEEHCTVIAYGFTFTNPEQPSNSRNYFILSFIIRPPWSNQIDLAQYIWDDRDHFVDFFNHLGQIRDLFIDPLDPTRIRAQMEAFRTYFTKLVLTLRKKHITIFLKE